MRKLISILLAICLVLSIPLSTYAATWTPSVDQTAISAGEDVTVTITLDEDIENCVTLAYNLYFNSELFTLKNSQNGNTHAAMTVSNIKTDSKGDYYAINFVDTTSEGQTMAAGTVYTFTFTAIEDVTEAQTASFELVFKNCYDPTYAPIEAAAGAAVSVTVAPPASTYAVNIDEAIENGTVTADLTIAAEGTEVTLTVTPVDGYELESLTVMNGETEVAVNDNKFTMPAGDVTITATFKLVESEPTYAVTITAPKDSTVSVGTMRSYYIYSFAEQKGKVEGADTVTYGFDVPTTSGNAFVRVQNPKGVTYWDYTTLTDGTVIEITEDMLFMNDSSHNANTIIRDLSEYEMDVADVYINANAQGYLPMNTGDTFTFNVYRDWHAVEGITNAKTALPDVSYQVIDINGSASDVVTIEPDANNSSVATMTANKAGTAIVLVTYDAMYSTAALHGAIGTDASSPEFFSAIWPENTGVLVVSVGADGSSIATNMTLNGHTLDAEHDVLYYVGEEGASYTFTPESGCKVSVARATLTSDSLTYNGFKAVDANEDGSFTVTGLTQGNHIIRVEKDGLYTYQVVAAKQTTLTITDADGAEINESNPVDPGETVTIQLGDLYNPVNKLSGIYNTNCAVSYTGEDNTINTGSRGSSFGYYLFASDPEVHKVTVMVPEVWAQDTYTLTGALSIGGFGSAPGAHRSELLYTVGKSVQTDAAAASTFYSSLPEIVIPVNASERIAATEVALNKTTLSLALEGTEVLTATVTPADSTDKVVWSSSDDAVATVDQNGTVTGIAAGEATITATAGEVSATCTVTVSEETAEVISAVTYSAKDMVYATDTVLLQIDVIGAKSAGDIIYTTYDYVDNGGNCTIPVAAGEYETLTLTLHGALGTMVQNNADNYYFYCNDTLSPNSVNAYTDYIYTTTVSPVWESDKATLTVGMSDGTDRLSSYTLILAREQPEGYYAVVLPEAPVAYTVTAVDGSTTSVAEGGSFSFTVVAKEGYSDANMVVKVNDSVLTAVDGVYTIENITATQTVTVEGVTCLADTPVFTSAANGTWGRDRFAKVETLYLGGATIDSHSWDGDTCTITLASDTPKDAKLYFMINWNLRSSGSITYGATLDGADFPADVPVAVTLKDGTATVEIYAHYNNSSRYSGTKTFVITTAYAVNIDETITNGTISAEPTSGTEGTEVTLTVTPDAGYQLATLTVDGQDVTASVVDNKYTFTMPAADVAVSATFKATVVAEGYSVTASKDVSIIAGENAEVSITVTEADSKAYNAYELNVSYPEGLTYAEAVGLDENFQANHDSNNRTIQIIGYGADKASGTAAAKLTFTGTTAGEYDVTITSAKVDAAAAAPTQDTPDATIVDSATKITVTGYTVTLGEGLTAESTVANPGTAYTFKATDADNYDYTVTAKIGDNEITVTDNGDGTYTIPADQITGNITVSAAMTPKTYDVTYDGTTTENAATYKTDYVFTPEKEGFTVGGVTVTIGGESYTGYSNADGTYTIPGTDITGDIVIAIDWVEETPATVTVNKSEGVIGGDTAAPGTDYTFSFGDTDNYEYDEESLVVKVGDTDITEQVTENEDGSYTIPGALITGDIAIEISRTEKSTLSVEVAQYLTLDAAVGNMYLVTVTGVPEGSVAKYDGLTMYWSEKYDAYAWLVISTDTLDNVKTAAAAVVTAAAGTADQTVDYSGDVNGTDKVDVNDAQLVYNMYNAYYGDFTTATMQKFLDADMNGDKTVNVTDAAAVVNVITGKQA